MLKTETKCSCQCEWIAELDIVRLHVLAFKILVTCMYPAMYLDFLILILDYFLTLDTMWKFMQRSTGQ